MGFQGRRSLELQVAEAIAKADAAERRRREAEERAARAKDLKGGILALHQPHAQHSEDHRAPLLHCRICAGEWPCETIQFVYAFGKYAPPDGADTAQPEE